MLKKVNYFGLMEVYWGLGVVKSKAYVYTTNPVLAKLCDWYLRLRGFRPKTTG